MGCVFGIAKEAAGYSYRWRRGQLRPLYILLVNMCGRAFYKVTRECRARFSGRAFFVS